jgi:hypothetical protein
VVKIYLQGHKTFSALVTLFSVQLGHDLIDRLLFVCATKNMRAKLRMIATQPDLFLSLSDLTRTSANGQLCSPVTWPVPYSGGLWAL